MAESATNQVVHITGARPNFPKAAPVIAALADAGIGQLLVHTGQHYDDAMSDVFFRQLGLPQPDVNLGVGSGSHGAQTARVMVALEELFSERQPELVVVYGDVNSTVAASLVAAKMHLPVAHVEAGLRSFDRTMPEEVNRVVTDSLADLLFTTSPDANSHLGREGVDPARVHFVGNPMIDTLLANLHQFDADGARAAWGLEGDYGVATLHRPANVDAPEQVRTIVERLHEVADLLPMVFPLHPRGRERLVAAGLTDHPGIHITDPLGYVEFMSLVRGSRAVVTDSGGVQEETTILGVPCLTLRPNTERPVTITHGTNRLVTLDSLVDAVRGVVEVPVGGEQLTPPLWDGRAGQRIARVIAAYLASRP